MTGSALHEPDGEAAGHPGQDIGHDVDDDRSGGASDVTELRLEEEIRDLLGQDQAGE